MHKKGCFRTRAFFKPHPINNKFTLAWLILSFLLCLYRSGYASVSENAIKEVLLIHSYHSGLKWTDDIHEAVKKEFSLSKKPINIQVEYLDAKRYGGKAFDDQLSGLLELKLAIRKYDVVIVSDDYAFRFVQDHRRELFDDIPIVFCGANLFRAAMIENVAGITGVVESPAFVKTIELALSLHPNTDEIVVINQSASLTGQANLALLKEAIPLFEGQIRFRFWSDLSWQELQGRLAGLKPGQLVLLTDVIRDERAGMLSFAESCRRVRNFCQVPIYGLGDYFLGEGIVGGKLLTGRDQGRLAAGLVLRIFAGESVDNLPVVEGDIASYMFDYRELNRFNISPRTLPQGSIIINQPLSVFSIPRDELFKVLLLLVGVVSVTLLLLKNVYSCYKAERALRKSEERFRGYFELNLVGMVARTVDHRWLEMNDKFCEIVKYSREELQGKTWLDLIHPSDQSEFLAQSADLCSGKIDMISAHIRCLCKDGSVVHVQGSTKTLCRPDGGIDRLVSIIQDITERTQAESALRLDEARLEALLALSEMGDAPDDEIVNFIVSSAIGLTGSKFGYLVFVNEADELLVNHGWTRGLFQEFSTENAEPCYLMENTILWSDAVRQKKTVIVNDSHCLVSPEEGTGESQIPIERFMSVPLLDNGKVMAVIGVGNNTEEYDDTDARQLSLLGQGLVRLLEARRVEQGVLESRQEYKKLSRQFQTLLDAIPDAIFLLTPDMRIVWGNEGVARYSQLDVRTLPGQSCYSLWHGRTSICPDCPTARCFHSGLAEEGTISTSDGRIWGLKAFPLKNTVGEVVNVIEMAVDITEKVKLRDETERSGRLAAVGELAAGVAHEINNPNGVLMLNSKFLADFFSESLPLFPTFLREQGIDSLAGLDTDAMAEEMPQIITDMLDSSKRISRIVKDLKEFVRLETEDVPGIIDLNDVIKIAVRLTGNMLKNSTRSFEVNYASQPLRVKGSIQQLEQVIINLIVNACQALGDKKGRIFITTDLDVSHRRCVVSVRDEGEGIDPKILPHITDPFFTTKRQNGGTGLGLSISSRIVREHRGKLEFFSEPDEGTTVQLTLPFVCGGKTK